MPDTRYLQNCSLIWCKRSSAAAVIDPGGDIGLILSQAKRRNLCIERILITHGHPDHAGHAQALSDCLDAPVCGPHAADRFLLERLPAATATATNSPSDWLNCIQWLVDGDTVAVGELTFDVRHCPGHTPGHVVFVQRAARLAWVGDVLFADTIGNTESQYGDLRQLMLSIVNRLWPFGDDIRFVPGHGRMSTFGAERCLNSFVSDIVVESLDLARTPP